jgi:hypothetical protein
VDPGCRKARDEAESGLDPLGELLAPQPVAAASRYRKENLEAAFKNRYTIVSVTL